MWLHCSLPSRRRSLAREQGPCQGLLQGSLGLQDNCRHHWPCSKGGSGHSVCLQTGTQHSSVATNSPKHRRTLKLLRHCCCGQPKRHMLHMHLALASGRIGDHHFSCSTAGSAHPQQLVSSTAQTSCQWLLSPSISCDMLFAMYSIPPWCQEAHKMCSRVKPPGPGGIAPPLADGGAKFAPPNPPGCPCWCPGPKLPGGGCMGIPGLKGCWDGPGGAAKPPGGGIPPGRTCQHGTTVSSRRVGA